MNYTVVWTEPAQQELARLWAGASDRNAVSAASNRIDRLLGNRPSSVGQVRFDTVRTLAVAPLGVDYEVIDDDRIVYVLAVWDLSAAP